MDTLGNVVITVTGNKGNFELSPENCDIQEVIYVPKYRGTALLWG
jgi:hypothetical protein